MLSKFVFTPGPTQVPEEVLKAVAGKISYHRSKEFKEFHLSLISKLKTIFQTEQNLNILTCSGTGAMEAAVTNFCKPKDEVIFINQGRFGGRWGKICAAYGLNAKEVYVEPGNSLEINEISRIDLSDIKAVFFTHTETSTATRTNLKELSAYVKSNSDALVIADAVTSVGAIEFYMDEWKVDVAISASQKGLMTPPGLAMIAYSQIAKEIMMCKESGSYYYDLKKELKSQTEGLTAWTPAVNLMYGMDKACDIVMKFGLEKWWKKVGECAAYVRSEGLKMGLKVFSKNPSDSLTAFEMPGGLKSGDLLKQLKSKYGIQMANGQEELRDRIFRVSQMGDLYKNDFVELMKLVNSEYNILKNS